MNWLLLLHIAALVFWLAFLVYLPSLVVHALSENEPASAGPSSGLGHPEFARVLFTNVATPAALLTILAGTMVFMVNETTEPWLIIKLTFVVLLGVNHVLLGLLLTKAENGWQKYLRLGCRLSVTATCVLASAVLWMVLAKPGFE